MTTTTNTTSNDLDLGFLIREPANVYHGTARSCLSSHRLADFRTCPLLFRRKELGLIPDRDSRAYQVGRAAHTLILEGRDAYRAQYAVGGPVNPRTGNPYGSGTKAYAEWAESTGKEAISDSDGAMVEQMAASVASHVFADELLGDGVPEGVIRCDYAGHRCQGRFDWINPVDGRGIVDLKTTDSLSKFEFDMTSYGYVHQLAFYRSLLAVACGEQLPVHIIAVEKREPYRCGVWQLSERVLEIARVENEQAMAELAECRRLDHWPTRYESLRLFDRI